jgi:hypothetical protein
MADSVSQHDFYGNSHMHYMASQSLMGETPEDLFHNLHLELQEHMRNPIAFHTEMMGDIMYLHQALKQKDASQLVDAVVREITLETCQTGLRTRQRPDRTICMVTLAHAQLDNQQDYQAQSQTESTWWQANLWHELL